MIPLDIPKNDNGEFQKMEDGLFHLRNSAAGETLIHAMSYKHLRQFYYTL